jgi:hypothetical protein
MSDSSRIPGQHHLLAALRIPLTSPRHPPPTYSHHPSRAAIVVVRPELPVSALRGSESPSAARRRLGIAGGR